MTTETAISSTPRSSAPPASRPGARAVIAMVTAAMSAALGLAGAAAGAGSLSGPAFAAISTLIGIEATLIVLGSCGFGLGAGSLFCGAIAGALGNGAGIAVLAVPCLLGLVLLGADENRVPHRLDPPPH